VLRHNNMKSKIKIKHCHKTSEAERESTKIETISTTITATHEKGMQHTDSHNDISRDCCNAVDKHQQTNNRRCYQPVCVVTKPCKVQTNLLTEIHSRSDKYVSFISTKTKQPKQSYIYITYTCRFCLTGPKGN